MADEIKFAQTRGTFEARGKLFNLKSENAVREITTKGGKKMYILNIGLRISDSEVMYLSLNGMEQDAVYFGKRSEKKGEKPLQEKVEWAKRNRFKKEGFRLIGGVNFALEKDSETGKNVATQALHTFDFIEYVRDHADELEGASVFVKGNIEHGSYEKDGSLKKTSKFIPNAIYLAKDEIDFQDDEFERQAEFEQNLVFNGIHKEGEEESATFILDAIVVGYRSVEDVSFEVDNSKGLADTIRKALKPFSAITMNGRIESTQAVDQVEGEVWGERSNMGRARNTARTTLRIVGALPETISTESHTRKIIEEYREIVSRLNEEKGKKEAAFQTQSGGWGETSKSSKAEVKEEESGDEDW